MDASRILRFAAAGFVVLAIALTAVQLRRPATPPAPAAAPASAHPADPLAPELDRCQQLGEAGARDARCLATWAQSRRRFLGVAPERTGG